MPAEALQRKIRSAEDMQSVVKTMKALAAASIRQYERAVESVNEYYRTVELGLQILVQRSPDVLSALRGRESGRRLALVFGSDYGMAGQFNDAVVTFAQDWMKERPKEEWILWAVGDRARSRLDMEDREIDRIFPVPSSSAGITAGVQEILLEIEDFRNREGLERVMLFFNRPARGASFDPTRQQLLPVDPEWLKGLRNRPWPRRCLPTFTMEPARLLSALLRSFLFVSIFRALAHSLAAENASRLASMQAAEKNIGERLDELTLEYHRQRQSAITEELMDVVSGFEALTGEGS
jgi:F-type H+-transporting ATPase subunit gamma